MTASAVGRASLAPPLSNNYAEWERTFHTWIMNANRGQINCTGRITLSPSQNATTVEDQRAGPTSFIGFMPITASAAVEWSRLVVQSQGAGIFAVSHVNNAIADRSYVYCIIG